MKSTAEGRRLAAADDRGVHWRRWGPYLSDRQWGTVREDYSDTGDAWSYFTHDQARSRAYRWGEDGIAGVSDDQQVLCLSLGLWNGADPILKERFFGLTNAEGNHGEDVKEYYFHLDSTPTHSYMRMLYKYPQAAYPYENLVATNRERSRTEFEYELLDTGVFAGDRYFDVEVEWAKADPEDLAALVTVTNRGPADAPLDVLANIWFRNTWAPEPTAELPVLAADGPGRIVATHARQWFHMQNGHILSMPDCWEYPWYAAWDLAFHCVPLSMVDPGFTRGQIELMLSDVYLHPSGQIPAYEWNFGDVNPPVHAWATLFAFAAGAGERTERHTDFLRDAFKKLLLNFSWWLNRKDPAGRNLFEGGFLGLDNIGVFDRSAPLPTGGHLEQADGTAWMALFSQNMLDLALILSVVDPSYEDLALKFVQHFFWIAAAMDKVGQSEDEMWDEQDGFYYDVLRLPDGSATRLRVRSMVGLIPLCAVSIIPAEVIERFPSLAARARENYERYADLLGGAANPLVPGVEGRRLLSLLDEPKLRRVLSRMLDETRFLSPHGIRSLSRSHLAEPFVFTVHGQQYRVQYLPAESDTGMFGGNPNWRGPVWFPINLLIIRALLHYYLYYGDDFTIECPTGSGHQMTLFEVAKEISDRLISVFRRDQSGHRPVYGGMATFQDDPHWRDLLLFHEYFHGDNGAGLGASHQTGWTGAVARLIQLFGSVGAAEVLHGPPLPLAHPYQPPSGP